MTFLKNLFRTKKEETILKEEKSFMFRKHEKSKTTKNIDVFSKNLKTKNY